MQRPDVDAMLDELTPEQFDEWQAFERIEPFGDEWRQAATIASCSHNTGLLAVAAQGVKVPDSSFLPPDKFMPYQEPDKQQYLSDAQMEHALRMMFPG